jgi:hypothetical protein
MIDKIIGAAVALVFVLPLVVEIGRLKAGSAPATLGEQLLMGVLAIFGIAGMVCVVFCA